MREVLVDGDADAESLAFALSQRGYALETTVEHTGTGRLATARTTSPSGAVIDLLFASSGIEPEIDQRGYGRGRRLLDDLEKALSELKS